MHSIQTGEVSLTRSPDCFAEKEPEVDMLSHFIDGCQEPHPGVCSSRAWVPLPLGAEEAFEKAGGGKTKAWRKVGSGGHE